MPTMKKVWPITLKLLENLYNDPAVGEIILIDNSETMEAYSFPFGDNKWIDKLKPVQMDYNMYVNPSWNWGVSKSSFEYIALVNDDILLPQNIMSALAQGPIEQLGVLGAYEPNVLTIDNLEPFYADRIDFIPVDTRWNAFGIFMVMHKSNYIPIPNTLLVWNGDDFLFHSNRVKGKKNGMLKFPIKTQMSATSDDPIFDDIKANDQLLYEGIKQQYKL